MRKSISVGSKDEEVEEQPQSTLWALTILLVVATFLISGWLVDSIDGVAIPSGVSKDFIGLILLPIVALVAEHPTSLSKENMALSLDVAIERAVVSSFPRFRRRDAVNSLPSSESRHLFSHSSSPLAGSSVVRLAYQLTRSRSARSFFPSSFSA